MRIKHTEETFTGHNGLKLYFQAWHPNETPKAVVAIAHGLGEHSGRYMNLVNYLVPRGFAIYALDHRGHGRSPGKQGHINSWRQYRLDLKKFLEIVSQKRPNLPLFLLGHSMGGLIVLDYALHHPQGLQGVISSSPVLGEIQATPVMLAIGRVLSRLLPSLTVPSNLDVNAISRDTAIVKAYQDDPLVHGVVSARWSTELASTIEATEANASAFKLPLLMIHGDADTITLASASQAFFANVTTTNKKYILYPGGYHESFNDLHYEQAVADVTTWLENHL